MPENASYDRHTGLFWSHEFAERIAVEPDETNVWLITQDATYHRFTGLVANTYTTNIPSDDYRALIWLGDGLGWALHDLNGTVTYFLANGLWRKDPGP